MKQGVWRGSTAYCGVAGHLTYRINTPYGPERLC